MITNAGPPAKPGRRFAQGREKGSFCAVRNENVVLQIAAVDHVVSRFWILQAKSTCHSPNSTGSSHVDQLRCYAIGGGDEILGRHEVVFRLCSGLSGLPSGAGFPREASLTGDACLELLEVP
jgi:hypothetical protein